MKRLALLLTFVLIATPATAANWELAQGPSSVKFEVKHLVFATVSGKFKKFEGSEHLL